VTFRIELPLVPSLNNAYATNRKTGRRFLTRQAANWKEEAQWIIGVFHRGRFTGPYRLTILLPEKMRGDVDNRAKLASDILVSMGVTPDDSKAVETTCRRDASVAAGKCVVVVEAA